MKTVNQYSFLWVLGSSGHCAAEGLSGSRPRMIVVMTDDQAYSMPLHPKIPPL